MTFYRSIDSKWAPKFLPDITTSDNNAGIQCDFLTFRGALDAVYDEFAKRISEQSTVTQYDSYFNNTILGSFKDHNHTWISQYTKEDYEDAIKAIVNRGQIRTGKPYEEKTIKDFKSLICRVVRLASEHGWCDDVLWGSTFEGSEETEQDIINENVVLKKSLSVDQEYACERELFSDYLEDGRLVGLLLMWALGLRNAEACGSNYGHIKPLHGHPECNVLYVVQTTVPGSFEIQSSGKTSNADRIIPLPDKLYSFLMNRKKALSELIVNKKIDVDIDSLPICCQGSLSDETTDISKRCSSSSLTAAGRTLFKRIGMIEDQLKYVEEELSAEETVEKLVEKDPTAYLFRRNFATHMEILGISESDIQYLIGHDIEDPYRTRNEYVNDDILIYLYRKLSLRPIFNTIGADKPIQVNDKANISDCFYKSINIKPFNGLCRITIETKEPEDIIGVSLKGEFSKTGITMMETGKKRVAERTINIISDYHRVYRSKKLDT